MKPIFQPTFTDGDTSPVRIDRAVTIEHVMVCPPLTGELWLWASSAFHGALPVRWFDYCPPLCN